MMSAVGRRVEWSYYTLRKVKQIMEDFTMLRMSESTTNSPTVVNERDSGTAHQQTTHYSKPVNVLQSTTAEVVAGFDRMDQPDVIFPCNFHI